MRNRILTLCAAVAGLWACNGSQGYTIEGPAEGDYAVLNVWNTGAGETIRDTVAIENGKFVFKGSVDEVFMGEVLVFADGKEPVRHVLLVENSPLKLKDGEFTGGPNNDFMRDMDAVSAGLDHQAPDFNDQLHRAMNECFMAHPDVEAAAFYFYVFNRDMPLDEYEAGFNNFTERVRNSLMGKNAREEIISRKATLSGIPAPTFILNDKEGNPVSLESLKGKYVLLDFWASWCVPCRESMPHLKEVYAEYHDKGLEFLGISTDSDPDDWKQALVEVDAPWLHVLDETPNKRESSVVAGVYGVHAVPTLFLIDPDGMMVGKVEHDSLDVVLQRLALPSTIE